MNSEKEKAARRASYPTWLLLVFLSGLFMMAWGLTIAVISGQPGSCVTLLGVALMAIVLWISINDLY